MSDTPNTRAVLQAADGRWTYSIKDFCESMERKLNEVQRDRDKALEQIESNHKAPLVIERMFYEVKEQRDRLQYEREFFQSALIEQGDVLSKVIEQRDRLAEAVRELCETLLADKPRDITELLNKAGDALAAWKEARSERR